MTTTNLFTNRATAKLAADVASIDTALTLVPGGGALFPAPAAGQYFRLVCQKGTSATDQREYMMCTGVAGDVLTVTRGLEGTPAANFTAGDEVSLVATALTLGALVQKVGLVMQGALEVEAPPTTALGVATKGYVDTGKLPDAPADGKDYARKDLAWHALGAAAGLAIPIPISAGGTGGTTLPAAQTNLVIGVTTIDDLEPATKKFGDRWIKPSNMTELVYVPNQGGATGVWINPMDAQSEAYPIPIAKGGTGATDAAQARINLGGTTVGIGVFTAASQAAARTVLGIDYTTQPFLLQDGSLAAPSLAWANEPGLGWYRNAAGSIGSAAQGVIVSQLSASTPATTAYILWPRASGLSQFRINNQPSGAANYANLIMQIEASGLATIGNFSAGTAGRGQIFFTAAGVFTDCPINIAMANPQLSLTNNNPAGASNLILGASTVQNLWHMQLGASGPGDFALYRQADGGAPTLAFTLNRATGGALFSNNGYPNLAVTNVSNGVGAALTLQSGAAVKTLRCINSTNQFEMVNAANNSVIFRVTDRGDVGAFYAYSCKNGVNGAYTANGFNFWYDGAGLTHLYIDAVDFGTINTTSDERVKHMIAPLVADADIYMKIKPIRFHFRDIGIFKDDGVEHWGFSAQNLITAKANAVSGDINAVLEDGTPQPAHVVDRSILAQTVAQVQDLIRRVAALEHA